MEIFFLTLKQILNMFTLILIGFLLRKKSLLPENSDKVMAKLETFIFVPALSLFTQMSKCTVKTFTENASLILYGAVLVVLTILAAYPLAKMFVRNADSFEEDYKRNVYRYAMAFSNYGFFGNFLILGVWGSDLFYKYSLFTFVISIFCNGWGLYVLIPKEKNAGIVQNLKKGLLTVPMIALVAGILLGLTGLAKFVPDFMMTALENASKCQGPVAMVLAGFVIGGYDLKGMLTNKKVYAATFLRLVLIPAVILTVLKLIGTSEEICILALVAYAAPVGLNTIVFPAAYGGDTTTGASMTMISSILAIVTLPLMYLLFIVR